MELIFSLSRTRNVRDECKTRAPYIGEKTNEIGIFFLITKYYYYNLFPRLSPGRAGKHSCASRATARKRKTPRTPSPHFRSPPTVCTIPNMYVRLLRNVSYRVTERERTHHRRGERGGILFRILHVPYPKAEMTYACVT